MKLKRKLSVILSLILCFVIPVNALAIDNTPKDEIVYISTDVDGEVTGVYVVNSFDLDKDQMIIDYGKYDNIKNLTNNNKINNENDKITFEAKKGKFFYQGDNPNKELPWNINIKYFLEDKEVSKDDIAGKEGEITIKGKITKNPKANPIYSNYYLGQLTISIDSKNATIKEYDKSSLAYKGSVQLLNYTVLPEKELEFDIKLESKNFEMDPINFNAIPFNMDFEMPDTSEFTDGLDQLESAISQLNDGTSELYEGANKLNSNTKILYDSIYQIKNGINQAVDGQSRLSDGTEKFQYGLNRYGDGINTAVNRLDSLGSGMSQLKDGLVSLRDGQKQLNNGLKEYTIGLEKYTDGVDAIKNNHVKLTDGLQEISNQENLVKDGGKKLVDGSNKIYEGLEALDKLDFLNNLTKEDMDQLGLIIDEVVLFWEYVEERIQNLNIKDLKNVLNDTKNSLEVVSDQLKNLSGVTNKNEIISKLNIDDLENEDVKKLLDEIEQLSYKIDDINNQIIFTNESINALIENDGKLDKLLENIKQNNENINDKLLPLRQSLREYDSEEVIKRINELTSFRSKYKKFHDGLIEYTNGTNKMIDAISNDILKGSKQFDKGLNELSNNGDKLLDGIYDIKNGAVDVEDGLSQILEKLDFGDLSQINELKKGIDLLVENHKDILNGQKELENGLIRLSDGLGQYINGFSMYADGIDEFSSGIKILNDGTNTLEDETNGMSDEAKKQIDEAMSAFNKEGFKLESFVDDKNKNINLVQFVYMSDALKAPENKKEVVEDEKQSFWEKLLDVITFWD